MGKSLKKHAQELDIANHKLEEALSKLETTNRIRYVQAPA